MHVRSGRNGSEEELRKSESESIAHGIYENVRHKEGEGVISENERTEGLSEESEMGICGAEDIVTSLKIEEDDCWRVKMDVETLLEDRESALFTLLVSKPKEDVPQLVPV